MKIGKNLGRYLKTGLGAAALIGNMAACEKMIEGTIDDSRATGESVISDIYNENGYQIVEMTIRRNAGDYLNQPPGFMISMMESSVPIDVVLASKKPIEAHVGDRLNFKYKYDKNRNSFENKISGWTKPKWCQVYPRR